MLNPATANYRETEILTATPQRLHLLLIEGAMRFVERGRAHWHAGDGEQACEAIIRAQEIVCEILGNLNREANPELTRKMSAYYQYVVRVLAEASLHRDEGKLADALRVLEVERETWRQVCEQSPGAGAHSTAEPPRPALPAASFPRLDLDPLAGDGSGSFSFEA